MRAKLNIEERPFCKVGLCEIASTEGECCVEGLVGLEHLRFMVFNH